MRSKQETIQRWIILALFLMSVVYSAVAALLVLHDQTVSDSTAYLWVVIFALLVALWAKNDAAAKRDPKPFEYSYFVFLLWPLVLPYHLIKSRGTEGFLVFLGFVAIHELPWIVATTAWAYFGGE